MDKNDRNCHFPSGGKAWIGSYRSTSDLVNSDSEDDESKNIDNDENDSPDNTYSNDNSFFFNPENKYVDAKTVRSSTTLYRATSECVSLLSKSSESDLMRNATNNVCDNSTEGSPHLRYRDISNEPQVQDSLSSQVATIGERVRRTLSFDSENSDCLHNSLDDSHRSSMKRTQSNLFKSLMKRSYQVSSESTWSTNCKQAKPDSCDVINEFVAASSNGSVETIRPDSPATLLGDEEVAQITSDAPAYASHASNGRCSSSCSDAIDILSNETATPIMLSALNSPPRTVFHLKTGLPLTSSPAPLRRGPSSRFDYDASLSSVAAIKR